MPLEAKLNSLIATAEDNVSRSDSITGHMKNVQQELNHTQERALYDAKSRQIETEEHFKQLADRETGRLTLEIKRIGNEITEITDHLNTLQNNIYRGNERIEAIRTELKLENDELAEWLRVQSEKEEDSMALAKYSKEDEAKIKELNLAIEKHMQEVNRKKAILSAEVTETQVAQIELDKTTEAFKQLHQERQDLINQWESAIKNMQKRDEDITSSQEVYQSQKEKIRQTQEVLKERQDFLEQQMAQNTDTEKNIGICERNVCKLRYDKPATELVNKKGELTNLKGELQDRQNKLSDDRKAYESLKEKLYRLDDETMTMEAKAEEIPYQLQEMLRREELKDKELDRQIKMLRELQFKKSQELFKLRQDEKNMSAEILGGEAALRNLKTKINKLDQEALKQRAMLYTMEFQIQQLERKLRRAQGDRTDEEKDILLKRIEELNASLEVQTGRWTLLNNQLKRSQEDLRHAKRQLDVLMRTKESIIASIDELNMYNESASHQLAAKTKEKEDVMVEENILRLELRKLRGFLNSRADEVFTLESRQVQLQLALEERAKEIEIHKDMLRIQIKNAEEERHSAAAELRERVGKVEKLKKRFEILMTQFAPEEGEEEHTQAYYVIKAAQRREELQREGDELDANIRRAEKEIKALENTLKLMNDRNEAYRLNLYKAELDSKDLQHKEMLETEYRQVMENYKAKREQIQDMQQRLQLLEQSLQQVSDEEASKLQSVQLLESRLQNLHREIQEHKVKRDRASKLIENASRQLRTKQGTGRPQEPTPDEHDFAVRKAREVGTAVLTELSRLATRAPEFAGVLQGMMQLHNVLPPSRALSRVSSRPDSVVGSMRDDASESGSSGSRTNGGDGGRRGLPSLPTPSAPANAAGPLASQLGGPRGPITGGQRIKHPGRPGSASSVSSHGSRGSQK
nr:Coiled-coil domain-containing protein 39 [Polyrhizophydium stewartii]